MKYNINSVIKRLQKAMEAGKTLIDENELLSIATPQVNSIDEQIHCIERGIKKTAYNRCRFFEAARLTDIPRKTFYRWEKEGILTRNRNGWFYIDKLKETLILIKQRKNPK